MRRVSGELCVEVADVGEIDPLLEAFAVRIDVDSDRRAVQKPASKAGRSQLVFRQEQREALEAAAWLSPRQVVEPDEAEGKSAVDIKRLRSSANGGPTRCSVP